MNTLKTLFLLATLTSMLVLMGALVGERIGYAMPGHMMGMRMVGASIGMGGMFLVAMIVNFGTWFFAHKIVIMSTGARPLRDNELVWLHQATEELAEAAHMPKPKLYIMDHEMSPNAFATGRSPRKGVVAVTAGLIRVLDQRQVRGVIAHELGHIKNRDTLVSAMASTLAGVITILAVSARWSSHRGRQRGNWMLFIVALLAPAAAVLVRMAISRTREYMADRRAAQLTGDPEGLALALERLGGGVQRQPMQTEGARNVHFFANGFGGGFGRWFSTHPPIERRVQALRAYARRQQSKSRGG